VSLATRYTLGASLLIVALCATAARAVDPSGGPLRVSDNRRFLVHADRTPFFYLGDTAWELFHRLNKQETE
jgi:hypothetical protein